METCRAQVAKPRCATRPANEEKRMATSIGFYLSAVIAAGIIFIGCRFLLAPSSAANINERGD